MIYHWTSKEKAATAVTTGRLQARRWNHFLEAEQRYAKGSSWSLNPTQWQRENEVCLVLDETKITNQMHHINGNRTYLLTMGMDSTRCYDPNAYKFESEEPDEVFVEGTIDLSNALIDVRVIDSAAADWSRLLSPSVRPRPSRTKGNLQHECGHNQNRNA